MQPFSDEDASIESLSHCSSFSDAVSVADEGNLAISTCIVERHVPLFEHVWVGVLIVTVLKVGVFVYFLSYLCMCCHSSTE